jgi:hypothetical protein
VAWADRSDLVLRSVRDIFGQPATVSLAGEVPAAVTVVFDAAYQLVALVAGVEATSTAPVALMRDSDLARAPRPDDKLFVAGLNWTVVEVQPDGQGGSLCRLERA